MIGDRECEDLPVHIDIQWEGDDHPLEVPNARSILSLISVLPLLTLLRFGVQERTRIM